MGEVVELEAPPKGGPGSRRKTQKSGDGRRRRSKTALVLGGGGFTGGVYQIGALRALDLLTVNRTVNDFDVYVGTSAGAFVSTLVASGVTPEEMSRVVNSQVPTPFREVSLGTLLKPNYADFATRSLLLPLRLAGLARMIAARWREVSFMDIVAGLAEALPPGMYTGAGVEKYIREILADADRTNDFRMLESELYLTATDLDTCERVVFGASIMNYSSRIEIARHGFESVTLKLAKDYHRYKRICEKHGIEISARRVTKILQQADEQREKVTAWRRILEQTTGALLRQSGEQSS